MENHNNYNDNDNVGFGDDNGGGGGGGGGDHRRKRRDQEFHMSEHHEETSDEVTTYESFEDMNLDQNLLRGVFSYGFEKPSPIQSRAIMPFIQGRDLIAQAQSGTGKTGAFSLGILGKIDPSIRSTQALILAHTRELAFQIDMVFRQLGNFMDLTYNLSVKGIPISENIDSLSNDKPIIVIGTPGRIMDMINKRAINMEHLKMLVMDEADEMLSKGFLEQIQRIFRSLPSDVQVGLFSATMTNEFFKITDKFMRNPIKVLVKSEQLTLEGISQYHINTEKNEYKFDTLCDLYNVLTISQSMIYCNSRRTVEYLSNKMIENNFTVSSIHGDNTPQEREYTMSQFRNGKSRVLISTDLLSRGIDVQQVSVVINYELPTRVDSYLHRIGRSGRFGRKGVAINFITYYDTQKLKKIEEYYHTVIEPLPSDISNLLAA
jgi:translation initiation factor 4A